MVFGSGLAVHGSSLSPWCRSTAKSFRYKQTAFKLHVSSSSPAYARCKFITNMQLTMDKDIDNHRHNGDGSIAIQVSDAVGNLVTSTKNALTPGIRDDDPHLAEITAESYEDEISTEHAVATASTRQEVVEATKALVEMRRRLVRLEQHVGLQQRPKGSGSEVQDGSEGSSERNGSREAQAEERNAESSGSAEDGSDDNGDGEHEDENSWEAIQKEFVGYLSNGYLATVAAVRDQLMAREWDAEGKVQAQAKAVAEFERYCSSPEIAEQHSLPSFDMIGQLYDAPDDMLVIEDERLRSVYRAMLRTEVQSARAETYSRCTAQAQEIAAVFRDGELFKQLFPGDKILGALKNIVLPALPLPGL